MPKKFIFFAIIGILFLFAIIFFLFSLLGGNSSNTPSGPTIQNGPNVVNVWILEDSKGDFEAVLNDFKSKNSGYSSVTTNVISFPNYSEYMEALKSSFISGIGPDIFVLNSNDDNRIFEGKILKINPSKLSPTNFKNTFAVFLATNMIGRIQEGEIVTEFVKGIPVGYETLGIFYNRQFIQGGEFSDWGAVNEIIRNLAQRNTQIIPLGMGDAFTTFRAGDILVQFLLLSGVNSAISGETGRFQEAYASYMRYADATTENGYSRIIPNLLSSGRNNFNAFSTGETAMVIGFPRDLLKIEQNGFRANFLGAVPFPNYFPNNNFKVLTNYNYFVANTNSERTDFAEDFLVYLASSEGAKTYLDKFTYYFPANTTLLGQILTRQIVSNQPITLENFYHNGPELVSFDKVIKKEFDEKIVETIENINSYTFDNLRQNLNCKSKIINEFTQPEGGC